jgi:hypothetical protein
MCHDLGWNDMGDDAPEGYVDEPAPKVRRADIVPIAGDAETSMVPCNVSKHQSQPEVMFNEMATPAKTRNSSSHQGHRVAFTLRLDAERHFKLRLACAFENRSVQKFVTEAIDRWLDEMHGLRDIVDHIKHT